MRTNSIGACCSLLLVCVLVGSLGCSRETAPTGPAAAQAEPWLRMLATGDPPCRVRAVTELGKIKHRVVVKTVLQTALNDHQVQVRIAATDALALPGILDEKELRSLILLLSAAAPEVRMAACRSLAIIRPPEAIDSLIQTLYDREASVRVAAAEALSSFGPAVVPKLTALFAGASEEQKVSVVSIMAASKDIVYTSTLVSALQDPSDQVRRACAEAIGRLGITSAVPALAVLARAPLSPARIEEFRLRLSQRPTDGDYAAMYRLHEEESVRAGHRPGERDHGWLRKGNAHIPTFKRVLDQQQRDAAEFIRTSAMDAIVAIAPRDLDAVLADMLGDSDEDLGRAVAKYLRSRDNAARPTLVAITEDTKRPILARCRAVDILAPLPPAPKRADTERLRLIMREMADTGDVQDVALPSDEIQSPVVFKLDAETQSLFTKLLADPDAKLRATAAVHLGRAGVKESVGPLIEAFRGAEPAIVTNAAGAMAAFKDERIAAALIPALDDARYASCVPVIVATLGAVGDKRASPSLLRIVGNHSNLNIRLAAIDALREINDPSTVKPMLEWTAKLFPEFRELHDMKAPSWQSDKVRYEEYTARYRTAEGLMLKAVEYLGSTRAAEAAEALLPLVVYTKGTRASVAMSAMRALGELKEVRAVKPISEAIIKYGVYNNRYFVNFLSKAGIDALVAIGDPNGLPVLKKLAANWQDPKDPFTGKYAIEAMGRIKHPDAVDALMNYLTDPAIDLSLKESCVGPALASAGVLAKPPLFRLVREAAKPPERASTDPGMYAAQILAVMEKPDINVVPDFVRLLDGKSPPHVAQRATEGLAQTHHEAAVKALADLVKNGDATVRQLAALALGSIKMRSAVPALEGALKDPDTKVRECAAYSLQAYAAQPKTTGEGNMTP